MRAFLGHAGRGALLAALVAPVWALPARAADAPRLPYGDPEAGMAPPAVASRPVLAAPLTASSASAPNSSGMVGVEPEEPTDVSGEGEAQATPVTRAGGAVKRHLVIKPYIEANQIIDAPLTPSGPVQAYTSLAAGFDALIDTRTTQGAVSGRYEHYFGEGAGSSGDSISGVGRFKTKLATGLTLDYGGYANQLNVDGNGAVVGATAFTSAATSRMWSVYAGPSLASHVGDVSVLGAYHAGYTQVDSPLVNSTTGGMGPLDHDFLQDARLALSTRPGNELPVGLGLEGGWRREDISNLDQRLDDEHVRASVTVPVSRTVEAVGGIGYEKVQVSSRDALVNADGSLALSDTGQPVVDPASPRRIAYDTSGLIWDVGIIWRPGRRTELEAHVGHRYGHIGGYGRFSWQPDGRTSVNVVVYDQISGFGGAMGDAIDGLPTDFSASRDAITGNLTNCVGSLSSGSCIGNALGSVNGAIYRGRGVMATWVSRVGHLSLGMGLGYDRRQYITGGDTALASLNGLTDQYYWISVFAGVPLGQRGALRAQLDAYRFQSGEISTGDMTGIRATGSYQYRLSRHVSASASLAIDGVNRDALDDIWTASGALGVRYSF